MTEIMWILVSAITIVLTALAANGVDAKVVIRHEGVNDPVSEGWTLGGPGPGAIGPGSEVTASGTHEFWRVEDAGSCSGCAVQQGILWFALLPLSSDPKEPAGGISASGCSHWHTAFMK